MGNEDQALIVQSKKNRRDRHHRSKVSTLPPRKLNSGVILVMRYDTMAETVLETKETPTRRRTTREDIMLMLQRIMNLPRRELDKKVMNLQVMKNMF